MEGTLATIMMFAGNFAPRAWMFCNGALLPISQYDALFALIGTTYGGDGQTTFALPDLRSRIPVGTGTGAGLSPVNLGESAGSETVTLNQSQLPAHQHAMSASVGTSSANADGSKNPTHVLATTAQALYLPTSGGTGTNLGGANVTVGPAGNSQPISVVQSFQAINYVICVEGIFPSRN
ncbi:MAG: tail fiber protein [Saprospiraceae bacterium]|nr:tail fiber protein [Saprospiraceae bacterium]